MAIFTTKEEEEIAKILGKINIFDETSQMERIRAAKFFRKKTYPAGSAIFKEGDPSDRMFVIRDGAVRVTKNVSGVEETLVNIVDGNFIGEMGLLEESPRSASVFAISNVEMLELYRVNLLQLIKSNPVIGVKIMFNLAKILSQRIRQSGDKIKDLLTWDYLKNENQQAGK
jgi:CRP/FNR family transcriptional regulator, cyclic AMP receptor protein